VEAHARADRRFRVGDRGALRERDHHYGEEGSEIRAGRDSLRIPPVEAEARRRPDRLRRRLSRGLSCSRCPRTACRSRSRGRTQPARSWPVEVEVRHRRLATTSGGVSRALCRWCSARRSESGPAATRTRRRRCRRRRSGAAPPSARHHEPARGLPAGGRSVVLRRARPPMLSATACAAGMRHADPGSGEAVRWRARSRPASPVFERVSALWRSIAARSRRDLRMNAVRRARRATTRCSAGSPAAVKDGCRRRAARPTSRRADATQRERERGAGRLVRDRPPRPARD
jgi:hypothetical protein